MKGNTDIDASYELFGRTNHFPSETALARLRGRESISGVFLCSTAKSQKMVEMAENELA